VFVAVGIQQAMSLRHIVIVACPALQNFSTLSHKRYFRILEKKDIENKMSVLFSLQALSETF
jgi:hypothetical protein